MANPTYSTMKAIAIIPMITGSISIFGSITVIYIVLRSHLRLSTPYHRLTFALALFDIFQSSSLALSTIPVPYGTPDVVFAIGNQITCNIQGFVNTWGNNTLILYFSGLTGYFFLAIKLGLSDEIISKYYEPIIHFISIGYGFVGAVFTISYSGYFTSGSSCWIAPRPMNCDKDLNMTCESATDFNKLRWLFAAGPTIFSFLIVSTNMLIIFWTLVCQNHSNGLSMGQPNNHGVTMPAQEQEGTTTMKGGQDANLSHQARESLRQSSVMELYAASKKNKKSSKAERDRREGMIQALLYIFTYIICYIFTFLYHALDGVDKNSVYWLFILNKTFFPLQGFFIFFIFIRPRIVNAKRRNSSISICHAFIEAVQSRGEKKKAPRRRTLLVKKSNMRQSQQQQQQQQQRHSQSSGDTTRRFSLLDVGGVSTPTTRGSICGTAPEQQQQHEKDPENGQTQNDDTVNNQQLQIDTKDSSLHDVSDEKRSSATRVSFLDTMVSVVTNLEQEIQQDNKSDGDEEEQALVAACKDDDEHEHDIEINSSSSSSSSEDFESFESPLLSFTRRLSAEMISRNYAFNDDKEKRRASL